MLSLLPVILWQEQESKLKHIQILEFIQEEAL